MQYGIMTNDTFINENQTKTLSKGDKVVMFDCMEADNPKNAGVIWTCKTDSYKDRSKQDVVFLEGFSGCFATKFLKKQ